MKEWRDYWSDDLKKWMDHRERFEQRREGARVNDRQLNVIIAGCMLVMIAAAIFIVASAF